MVVLWYTEVKLLNEHIKLHSFIIEIIQALNMNMTFNFYNCIIVEKVKFLNSFQARTHIIILVKMTAFADGWVYVKVDLKMNMQIKYNSFLHWI